MDCDIAEATAVVDLHFYHACDHADYTQTVNLPAWLTGNTTLEMTCPVDHMTMLVYVRVRQTVVA